MFPQTFKARKAADDDEAVKDIDEFMSGKIKL